MKKIISICIVIVLCSSAKSQKFILGDPFGCGTWVTDTTYSSWETIDTIGNRKISDTIRVWVYNDKDEPLPSNNQMTLAYCPCGCNFKTKYWQYRICKVTGIRQKRLKENYTHIIPPPPPPKTEYEKVIDSFNNK